MLKAVYTYESGIEIVDVEPPKPRDDEVLVRMEYAGLCHSDIHYMKGEFKYGYTPITPGHEGSGVVEEVGDNVTRFKPGDRVVIDYVRGCGKCVYCLEGYENRCIEGEYHGFELDGTFQEYISLPEDNLVRLPDNIPLSVGAIIGCAIVTPYHAIKAVGGVEERVVAIIGVGGVGIHGVLLSKILGAKEIYAIDIDDSKRGLAVKYGADYFINPMEEDPVETILKYTGYGVDVAFEFVGREETIEYAIDIIRKGGTALIAGLLNRDVSLNPVELISSEKIIMGVEDHTHRDLVEVIDVISSRNIDLSGSITHYYELRDLNKAVQHFMRREPPFIRIVIKI